MNEYQLVDAMTSLQNNLIQGQAVTITMLSACIVVAYAVGAEVSIVILSLAYCHSWQAPTETWNSAFHRGYSV